MEPKSTYDAGFQSLPAEVVDLAANLMSKHKEQRDIEDAIKRKEEQVILAKRDTRAKEKLNG